MAADGTSLTGEVPPLPEGALFGPHDVVVSDNRGETVLPSGVQYVPAPSITDPQVLALRALRAASAEPVVVAYRAGVPEALNTRIRVSGATPAERGLNFLQTYRDLFGLSAPERDFELGRVRTGPLSTVALRQRLGGWRCSRVRSCCRLSATKYSGPLAGWCPTNVWRPWICRRHRD
ncbi:MAG: hypothetical protein M5U12_30490 [Verrucomicrobia bacterium]|nr:hypothetical protein [Verrucomicrobiota bacterium]